MFMEKGSSDKWTIKTELWLKKNTRGCPADLDVLQAILFLAWSLSATLWRDAHSKQATCSGHNPSAKSNMDHVVGAEQRTKSSCRELYMGGRRKCHQVVASHGGCMFIWVFHSAMFICSLDASEGCGAVEEGGEERRKEIGESGQWGRRGRGSSSGQILMSISEPDSLSRQKNHMWPVSEVSPIVKIAFWQCLYFSHDCNLWDCLWWRDLHGYRKRAQPHPPYYLSGRKKTMVVLHLSGQLWDTWQKAYGDLWVVPGLKLNN